MTKRRENKENKKNMRKEKWNINSGSEICTHKENIRDIPYVYGNVNNSQVSVSACVHTVCVMSSVLVWPCCLHHESRVRALACVSV